MINNDIIKILKDNNVKSNNIDKSEFYSNSPDLFIYTLIGQRNRNDINLKNYMYNFYAVPTKFTYNIFTKGEFFVDYIIAFKDYNSFNKNFNYIIRKINEKIKDFYSDYIKENYSQYFNDNQYNLYKLIIDKNDSNVPKEFLYSPFYTISYEYKYDKDKKEDNKIINISIFPFLNKILLPIAYSNSTELYDNYLSAPYNKNDNIKEIINTLIESARNRDYLLNKDNNGPQNINQIFKFKNAEYYKDLIFKEKKYDDYFDYTIALCNIFNNLTIVNNINKKCYIFNTTGYCYELKEIIYPGDILSLILEYYNNASYEINEKIQNNEIKICKLRKERNNKIGTILIKYKDYIFSEMYNLITNYYKEFINNNQFDIFKYIDKSNISLDSKVYCDEKNRIVIFILLRSNNNHYMDFIYFVSIFDKVVADDNKSYLNKNTKMLLNYNLKNFDQIVNYFNQFLSSLWNDLYNNENIKDQIRLITEKFFLEVKENKKISEYEDQIEKLEEISEMYKSCNYIKDQINKKCNNIKYSNILNINDFLLEVMYYTNIHTYIKEMICK